MQGEVQGIVEFISHLRSLDVQLSARDGRLNCTAPKGVLTEELKEQLKENKFRLIAFLSQNDAASGINASIPRIARDGHLSPSFGQERLWFMEQFEGQSPAYNIAGGTKLTGVLDREALEKALKEIVGRHEVLRTAILSVYGVPKLSIPIETDWRMDFHSLLSLPADQRDEALREFASQNLRRPFDLSSPPLIRASLVELSENEHVLLFNVHHIAADGWSLSIISEELVKLYTAFREGQPSPLPELPLQYADYAHWHREYLQNGATRSQLPFWKNYLRDPLPALELPYDRPRPPVVTYRGQRIRQTLPKELLSEALRFSTAENVTLFASLLGVFNVLLFRYSRQSDVIVGTAAAGRTRPELEKLVGLFINNLPLRNDLSGDPTVRELLGRVRESTLSAFSHQDVSFGEIVDHVQARRDLDRSPLFQVMFILQNFPARTLVLPGLTFEPMDFTTEASRFDLTVEAGERDEELELQWEYNTDLFDPATILRMQTHFERLLRSVIANPGKRISELPMLPPEEQQALIELGKGPATGYPRAATVHQLFEQQRERNPRSLAIEFQGASLTYDDLSIRSNRLANRLRALGVGSGSLVGICLDRSPELAVALLGVLKSGGAYVPIDPQYPPDRIAFMLEDSGARVLITEETALDALPKTSSAILCVDRDRDALLRESSAAPAIDAGPESIAYVIYTSGSTGKPKGVEISHRSIVNFLSSMRRQPGMGETDRLLAVTTLSFDIAGLEFYLPLSTGASVVIAPRFAVADGLVLTRLLEESRITVMQATPATWRLLLDSGWAGTAGLKILCGGEALPRELANRLLETGSEVWNLYGPTETTIWSAIQRVDSFSGSVPIGRPIANTDFLLLDERGNLVPRGVPGELHIGGEGLARGYLHRPELTAEKFVPSSFAADKIVYRTGDLARWLSDGSLEYLGRMDTQVKLRGFRIELGEIETAMEQQPDVRQAVAIVREDVPGDQRLTAYVVMRNGAGNAMALREALHKRLPEYMIPSQFVFLEALPLTPNRKVNRKALPAPEVSEGASVRYAPPRTETERNIVEIWQELLKNPRIGINENFFDLGGHSLLVVQLQTRLRRHFQHELSLVELFQHPTVSAISKLLDTNRANPQGSSAEPAIVQHR